MATVQDVELTGVGVVPEGEEKGDDAMAGLTSARATELLQEFGPNEIPDDIQPVWWMILKQFWDQCPYDRDRMHPRSFRCLVG